MMPRNKRRTPVQWVRVSLFLTADQLDILDNEATFWGYSRSTIIRQAIDDAIATAHANAAASRKENPVV